ncbi:enoyl-CoA hydratase [Natronocella acetinitrilica]|uniref:enoyl-CoA hydratase n=1 Tax=Natronocella acetinitrilica TaxID=414046 RepID=A0AAE3G4E7_9GAMM|nr:enoyl-CoA hydratase-related protein [Natronocella acetinitrilica]MCP1673692.1 enoyl-CoA hydratase [Natronocella acetinitrilica]
MSYQYISVDSIERVGRITINRPQALNALSVPLMDEVGEAINAFEADEGIGAIIITGTEKAFAAGADIKDMAGLDGESALAQDFPYNASGWHALNRCRKPVIAAVSGFALGGGCELAMACDFIIAADNARFGQPEVKLGIIPGAGGTQRLIRAVGKAKAMELCLTGRMMEADEAERAGLVAYVTPADELQTRALATAQTIAAQSSTGTAMIKDCINQAMEIPLSSGLVYERRVLQALFGSDDQREGMTAFVEKRKPAFKRKGQ